MLMAVRETATSARVHVARRDFRGFHPDPAALWRRLEVSPWRFWLDSGPAQTAGRFTYLSGGEPLWVFRGKNGLGEVLEPGRAPRRFPFTDPLAVLRERLDAAGLADAGLPALVGYWGYESGRYFDDGIAAIHRRAPRASVMGYFAVTSAHSPPQSSPKEGGGLKFSPLPALGEGGDGVSSLVNSKSPTTCASDDVSPDLVWVLPSVWITLDRDGGTSVRAFSLDGRADASAALRRWEEVLEACPPEGLVVAAPPAKESTPGRANRAAYLAGVRRVKSYIAAGDVYQANLTHRLDLSFDRARELDFFQALRALNPSPYAALLRFPDHTIASCSPELLLRVRGRRAETRPIAGTRPRGATAADDRRLSGALLLSPKERAEHIMLVDLARNDLGRVCRPGTVRVSDRMALEKYSHVIHIVSHVEGRLAAGRDGFDAVRALFPGGTITGCPKIRCMEILHDLEGVPRGPFYGSAGWISAAGDMDLNILIRTALLRDQALSVRVGAGIVADSDPAREFEETLHKARALVAAWRACRETA